MIRVGVLGAAGRMGQSVSKAVAGDKDLILAAAVSPAHEGQELGALIGDPEVSVRISSGLEALQQADVDVAVDFTRPDAVMDNVRWAVRNAIHIVVGTTGLGQAHLDEIRDLVDAEGATANVLVAPNFALGAVLMQRFAAEAARLLPSAEIIELHHDGKVDAPSGTSLATAERIASARASAWTGPHAEAIPGARGADAGGIRIHSVRLPGLLAHQEVIFGGLGQTLTIRHDSLDRAAFMPGVLIAIKAVAGRPGLTVGLEPLLGLDRGQEQ